MHNMRKVNFVNQFKSLPVSTKRLMSLGGVLALFVALPLFIWAIVTQTFLFQKKAASGEPTPSPTVSVDWETAYAQFIASDFYINVNGQKFVGSPMMNIHSDPGSSTYTTLEASWNENGVEMRMYLYFGADDQNWWLKEARIYNGQPNGDWVYLLQNAQVYKTPIGQAYSQNIPGGWLLAHTGSSDLVDGVHFSHLDLKAFANRIPGGNVICSRNPPGISFFPHGSSVSPGNAYQFTLVVKNNDSGLCSYSDTQLTYEFPTAGWSVYSPITHVYSGAGDTNSFDIEIVNPADTLPGTYYPVVRTSENGIGPHSSAFTIPYPVNGNATPGPTCVPRPSCLDANPRCLLPEPIGGWCTGAGECQMCGGIAGISCTAGLTCSMSRPFYPDQSGICVKTDGTSRCGASPTPQPTLRVTAPNGGENLTVGQNYTITWQGPGRNTYLLYLTNALGEQSLIDGASASASLYNWKVNSPIMNAGSTHKIKIVEATTQNALSDESDNFFNIYPSVSPSPASTPTPAPVAGDVNGDGLVNIVDIGIIVDNYRLSPPDNPAADLNHDGLVNIIDIGIVVDHYQS